MSEPVITHDNVSAAVLRVGRILDGAVLEDMPQALLANALMAIGVEQCAKAGVSGLDIVRLAIHHFKALEAFVESGGALLAMPTQGSVT
jgi:hypothetical protein